MNTTGQAVMDRLKGLDPKELTRIRKMGYYTMWKRKAEWLKSGEATPKDILYAIHGAKDERSYGYKHLSDSSREALDLVLLEEGWK